MTRDDDNKPTNAHLAVSDSSSLVSTVQLSEDDTAWWHSVAESCVRVTFAGFAGTLIGQAKEQQQQQQQTAAAPEQQRRRPVRKSPPRAFRQPKTNLPVAWGMGCTMFVLILEMARKTSPTTLLVEYYTDNLQALGESSTPPNPPSREKSSPGTEAQHLSFHNEEALTNDLYRAIWTATGDYTIGGTVAGLAGALTQRQRRLVARTAVATAPTVWSLTFTGMCFGVLAGLIQGATDAGSILADRQQQQQQEEERRKSEENLPGKDDSAATGE